MLKYSIHEFHDLNKLSQTNKIGQIMRERSYPFFFFFSKMMPCQALAYWFCSHSFTGCIKDQSIFVYPLSCGICATTGQDTTVCLSHPNLLLPSFIISLIIHIMSFRPILQLMLLALSCNQAFSWIVTCPINDKRSTPPQRSSHLEGRCNGGGRIHHCWHNNNEKISSVQQPSLGRRGRGCRRRNGLHVEAVSSGQVEVLSSTEIPVVIPSLLLVFAALGIGIAAQSLINQQLKGDQGLSAFLKDGSGYSKSAFRPIVDNDRAVSQGDPLPWLKLPTLDFVEVAGQQPTTTTTTTVDDNLSTTLETLTRLRLELNEQVAQGNTAEAQAIKRRLEKLMVENGIAYNADE